MARTTLWRAIHDTLMSEITQGHYAPGDRLPTEARLAERFGVNRHTVRRALAALAEQGITRARRGAGVFVRHIPTPYSIGRRVRFHQNIRATGHTPEKRVLSLETRLASEVERAALTLGTGAKVHAYEGLSMSSGTILAHSRSVFPAARFPGLPARLKEGGPITDSLRAEGVLDYTRASTLIAAKVATPAQAALLELRPGDPILRTTGVNVDQDGQPVEYGRTWFAADRVTLTLIEDEEAG